METAIAETLKSKLKGLLLLNKHADAVKNILAMLGLFAIDFPDHVSLQIIWDEDEITIQSATLKAVCTCAKSKDPKTERIRADERLHATTCDLAMQAKLVAHPCLIDVDGDDEETVWTFQWPRDISANRYAIQETFIELKQDILWTNFQKAWHGIVVNMPEPLPSLADRLKEEDKEEIEYAEAEMKHNEPTYEDDLDFDSAGQDEANETPTTDLPFEEPEPASTAPADTPKRKRGRPTGTTKQAKQDALELPPGGLTPTETNGKKALPGCVRFGKMASEEFSRLCPVVQSIIDAETFPKETIEGLKNSLDRLALRTAHLLYRGAHDADDPTSINPLIEVTLANTTAAVNAAVRDLGLCPEKAGSWEKFASDMKEVIDLAKHANGLMSQMGAGPTIQDPAPRLKDAEGKVLVP